MVEARSTTTLPQAVIIKIPFAKGVYRSRAEVDAVYEVEEPLLAAVEASGAGWFDHDERGQGELIYWLFGSSAKALFAAIKPVLQQACLPDKTVVIIRLGPPGSTEVVIPLPQIQDEDSASVLVHTAPNKAFAI